MAGVNKVILIGNLGADPEVKYLSNGTTVANFRIATSENRVNKTSGEKTTLTEWHRIVAFGRLAEICGEYLSKGRQIYVEGRIRTRSWEDKEGNKRFTTEIVANQMQMLGTAAGQAGPDKEMTFDQGPLPEPNPFRVAVRSESASPGFHPGLCYRTLTGSPSRVQPLQGCGAFRIGIPGFHPGLC